MWVWRGLFVAVGALVIAGVACTGGSSKSGATRTAPVEVPTGAPEVARTPSSTITAPRRGSVANGEALPSANGLLYVSLDSGKMEFWTMPGRYAARPISRNGRWVFWSAEGIDGSHMLDTETGRDRVLTLGVGPATARGISADGQFVVVEGAASVALLETDSGRILAETSSPATSGNGAAEFAPDGSAALGFGGDDTGSRTTLILRPNGTSSAVDGGTWPIRWSPDGSRLAMTTATGTRILSAAAGPLLDLPFGPLDHGYNPRWSPDGRYLAVANTYNVGGQRVFDAATGVELLRAKGTPNCLGDYWFDDGTLEFGGEGLRLVVPSGEVRQGVPRWPRDEGFTFDNSVTAPGVYRLILSNGIAAEFKSAGNWSVSYDGEGVHGTTSDHRALFLIGIGGKGLCDGGVESPAIQLPPFPR